MTKTEIDHYIDGIKEGVSRYAWMKDGTTFVGTCGRTLKEAYEDIEEEKERLKKDNL